MHFLLRHARIFAGSAPILLLLSGIWLLRAGNTPPESAKARNFRFTYSFTVRNIRPGNGIRIWFPAATSDGSQSVRIISATGDLPLQRKIEPEYGNTMYYAETGKATQSTYHFSVVYEVERREHLVLKDGELVHRGDSAPPAQLARFLQADRLVPISGKPAELADAAVKGRSNDLARARAIYDYVLTHMRYDRSGTGWGRGDTLWACDSRHGNCTDFHSLFISMARAEKIPARFEIGFLVPDGRAASAVAGYHCWAEFYLNPSGWVPVDISEAWKRPSLRDYFFGAHDADRVQFSIGRDITLQPRQQGPPLNYFVYPYVEVNGREFNNVALDLSYQDTPTRPEASGTGRR